MGMSVVNKAGERVKFVSIGTPRESISRFFDKWLHANGGNHEFPFLVTYDQVAHIDKSRIDSMYADGDLNDFEFQTDYLCQWSSSEGRAIPVELWDKNVEDYPLFDMEKLAAGQPMSFETKGAVFVREEEQIYMKEARLDSSRREVSQGRWGDDKDDIDSHRESF